MGKEVCMRISKKLIAAMLVLGFMSVAVAQQGRGGILRLGDTVAELINQHFDRSKMSRDDRREVRYHLRSIIDIFASNGISIDPPRGSVNLYCDKNSGGYFIPHNRDIVIGAENGGANRLSRCEEYLATQKGDLLCSYDGNNFLPYTVDGLKIGGATGGARTLERCVEYMNTRRGDILCSYTGQHFLPHTIDGVALGGENGGGARTLERCAEYMATKKGRELCSYNGSAFQIYDVFSGKATNNRTYSHLEDCARIVDRRN